MSTVHILHFPAAWILSVIGSYLPKRIELKLERYRDSQQEYPLYEVHIVEVYKNMMGIQRLSREITLHRLFQHSTEESSIKLRQLEPGSKQIKRHSSSHSILARYGTPVDTKSLLEIKKCEDIFREDKSVKGTKSKMTESPRGMNWGSQEITQGIYNCAPAPLSHMFLGFWPVSERQDTKLDGPLVWHSPTVFMFLCSRERRGNWGIWRKSADPCWDWSRGPLTRD